MENIFETLRKEKESVGVPHPPPLPLTFFYIQGPPLARGTVGVVQDK